MTALQAYQQQIANGNQILAQASGEEDIATSIPVGQASSTDVISSAKGSGNPLSTGEIENILSTEKGNRPDPSTYLSSDYIATHLAQFDDGATKFMANPPKGVVGPPGGTFVMPASTADQLVTESNGRIGNLENLLGLEQGTLGSNPVRVDIKSPSGLRIPSGNEPGANSQWVPGGFTSGGIPEATINPVTPGKYTVNPIFK